MEKEQLSNQPTWGLNSGDSFGKNEVRHEPSEIAWTASEFIAHQKNASWYIIVLFASIAVSAGVFLLTRDISSTVMLVIAGGAVAFMGAKKPRTLKYIISDKGISVEEKFYGYDLFKSFSVIEEGEVASIYLSPLKRFMPAITMYFDPQEADKILDVLDAYLPEEHRDHDFLDKMTRKIRL